jgi:predicted Kef-type K+ transport protein
MFFACACLVVFAQVGQRFVGCLFVFLVLGFGSASWFGVLFGSLMESLILAQDERWRRASHMQVERITLWGG